MSIELYEKITKDVEAVVKDLTDSWDMWHFHEGVTDVVNGNLDHLNGIDGTNEFFTMVRKMYTHSVCLGVRRQVKSNRDSISLMTILDLIKTKHASQKFLSREKFRQWWSHNQWYGEYFEMAYETLLSGHSDISHSIEADIFSLKSACLPLESYADKIVAHRDRIPPELPCFNDIDIALTALSEVALKFHNGIGGDSLLAVKPTYLFHAAKPLQNKLDIRE